MIDILIKNASELVTCMGVGPKIGEDLNDLHIIKNGNLAINDGKIIAVGDSNEDAINVIDAMGKVVMPGFIDCHTHLVFAGSREEEFIRKIKGESYLEILRNDGGIFNTVEKTKNAPSWKLIEETIKRIEIALSYGTTTMEVKSGYGLDVGSELVILSLIKELQNLQRDKRISLVSTFLGAHVVPLAFKDNRKGYIREIFKMIEMVRERNLAEYCDVFVELGAFYPEEARKILEKAKKHGFRLKLHAGEFNDIGGVELGGERGGTSMDPLDYFSNK